MLTPEKTFKLKIQRAINRSPMDIKETIRIIDWYKGIGKHNVLMLSYIACDVIGIPRSRLITSHKKQEAVEARKLVMFYLYQKDKMLTLKEIGNVYFKGHATVLYAVRKINDSLSINDKVIKERLKEFNYLTHKYKEFL